MTTRAVAPDSLADWHLKSFGSLPTSGSAGPNPFRKKPATLKGEPGGEEVLERTRTRQPVTKSGTGDTAFAGGGPFFGGPRTITAAPGGPVVGHGPPNPFRVHAMDRGMDMPGPVPPAIGPPAPSLPLDSGRPPGAVPGSPMPAGPMLPPPSPLDQGRPPDAMPGNPIRDLMASNPELIDRLLAILGGGGLGGSRPIWE